MRRVRIPLSKADFGRLYSAVARAARFCKHHIPTQGDSVATAAMLLATSTLVKLHKDLCPQMPGCRSDRCRGPLAVDFIAGRKLALSVEPGAHDVLYIVILANCRSASAGAEEVDTQTHKLLDRILEAAKACD
ncbi:hypothetical protein [Halomonas sp. E19]|uniref:hypothetical protein n=1 Tax=Halomonas sp. E19 TaxID=3397247 RepID=UPI0040335BDC